MINKRKYIDWLLLIIWMIFIYYMSNQPAEISDNESKNIIILFSKIGIDINSIFGQLANFVVRKSAHFIEYMILAFLISNVLNLYFNMRQVIIMSIIFTFIYASTDEFHQLFVPGREGALRDVLIDTCGGITLVLIRTFIKVQSKKSFRKSKF